MLLKKMMFIFLFLNYRIIQMKITLKKNIQKKLETFLFTYLYKTFIATILYYIYK